MEEGARAISRATRKTYRPQPGFNPRTCEWNRHSLRPTPGRGPNGDHRTSSSTTSRRSTPPRAPAEPQKKPGATWFSNAQDWRGSEESSWWGRAPGRSSASQTGGKSAAGTTHGTSRQSKSFSGIYTGPWPVDRPPSHRGELTKRGGNSNGGRISLT